MLPEPAPASSREARLRDVRSALKQRAESFVATLEFVSGGVDIEDPLTATLRGAETGQRLARGMKLHVRSGRALVRFDDGSDVWLATGTTLDLSPWSEAARSLRLVAGRALALVAREVKRPFVIATAQGEVRALGTAFETHADAGLLSVSVLHGRVAVKTLAGTVEAVQGRLVQAIEGMPLRTSRVAGLPSIADWLADLSPSAHNPRIQPAYKAVAKKISIPASGRMEQFTMSSTTKLIAAAAVLAIIGVGAFASLSGSGSSSSPDSSPSASAPAPGTFNAAIAGPNGKAPQVKEDRKITMKFAGKDGKPVEISAKNPDDLLAQADKFPPEVADKLREIAKSMKDGNGPVAISMKGDDGKGNGLPSISIPGLKPAQQEAISRDLGSAIDAYKGMVAKGMPRDKASEILNKALNDSLSKQMGGDTNGLKVHAEVGGDGSAEDGGVNKIKIGITMDSETGGPGPIPGGGTSSDVTVKATDVSDKK